MFAAIINFLLSRIFLHLVYSGGLWIKNVVLQIILYLYKLRYNCYLLKCTKNSICKIIFWVQYPLTPQAYIFYNIEKHVKHINFETKVWVLWTYCRLWANCIPKNLESFYTRLLKKLKIFIKEVEITIKSKETRVTK